MESIFLKQTRINPEIYLDREKEIFKISGASIPENASEYFRPILDWIDEYSKNPLDKTEFIFNLNYFNTSTSKKLIDILMKLKTIYDSGKEVLIKWYHEEKDEDMKESGVGYKEISEIPFEFVSYNSD